MPGGTELRLSGRHSVFDRFAGSVTRLAGTPWAFAVALLSVVVWGATGPIFGFSETWQMVVNTGTTIITFLMVFLIQRSQNKDALAIHMKLNEIVAALEGASNRMIDVEALSEKDLQLLHKHFVELARLSRSAASREPSS